MSQRFFCHFRYVCCRYNYDRKSSFDIRVPVQPRRSSNYPLFCRWYHSGNWIQDTLSSHCFTSNFQLIRLAGYVRPTTRRCFFAFVRITGILQLVNQ